MRLGAFFVGAAAAGAGLVPTPVGTGPRYLPPARSPATRFACLPGALHAGARVHIELFARRQVVIVPTGIGLEGARRSLGRVHAADCRARVWTLDPSGIVGYVGNATLGRLFRVWGQPLGPARLASFRGPVSVYVNGVRRPGDPRSVPFRVGNEIVLEVGGYVPPHRSFLFPP